MSISEVVVYSRGLFNCSVCAPKEMDVNDVTNAVNVQYPAGTTNGWVLSEDKTFKQGGPMPGPCDQNPETRIHYLFNC
jgi:hypothetical protein